MVNNQVIKVPNLTTALKGPLQTLEKLIIDKQTLIEAWLREQWLASPPIFYSSVDLRNAGFKLAPIDTNLFPAGFNNLNPDFMPLCIQAVQATMEQIYPKAHNILLIPENHTRNTFYFESLATLYEILHKAGFVVRIGSMLTELTTAQDIQLPSGRSLKLEPLKRDGDRINVENFSANLILLNNDLSAGVPTILQNLSQTIVPSLNLGWFTRLKSTHFSHYQTVSNEFAQKINIDPWLISAQFRNCGEVDFMHQAGQECLLANAEALLQSIQKKYDEYGIEHKPFIIVKADAGTYGMAVMTIQNVDELLNLNRKERTRMSTLKGGKTVTKVIIQEGVYTFETWNTAAAEPVVYMIGRHVVGGFYRVHSERGSNENLNAPGMNFKPLAFASPCNNPSKYQENCDNRFYTYGVIARLAALAAAREARAIGGQGGK